MGRAGTSPAQSKEIYIMSIANRLITVLKDAKENHLAVEIKEQADGKIFTSVCDGYYTESFQADSLEYLTHRLEMIVDDWRRM